MNDSHVYVEVDDPASVDAFRLKFFPLCRDEAAAARYLDSLVLHIKSVREAGRRLRVLSQLLELHDQSKFSAYEFRAAVDRFHGGDPEPDAYAAAWLHHVHNNPHHWQHWMFPDGFSPRGSSVEAGVMEMPRQYVLEKKAANVRGPFIQRILNRNE